MSAEISVSLSWALWCLFAFFEGRQEAFWFHIQDFDKPFPRNPHVTFTLRRMCVLILSMLFVYEAGCDSSLVESLSAICVAFCAQLFAFPFFHDGSYYMMRNVYNSDVYHLGWFSNPIYAKDDMSAKFSLNHHVRSALFIVSLFVMFFYVIL